MHNNLSLQPWIDSQADSFLNFGSRKTIKVHLTERNMHKTEIAR